MIFQVEHLRLTYPARRGQPPATILDDVSVDVARGGALVLVGPSGSGKSSLLRCLNRLEEPTAGVVRFVGRAITELDPRELRRSVAVTPAPELVGRLGGALLYLVKGRMQIMDEGFQAFLAGTHP